MPCPAWPWPWTPGTASSPGGGPRTTPCAPSPRTWAPWPSRTCHAGATSTGPPARATWTCPPCSARCATSATAGSCRWSCRGTPTAPTPWSPPRSRRCGPPNRRGSPHEERREVRICFASRRYWPAVSGMSAYAENLLRHLVRQGHEVTLVSQYRGDPAGRAVYGGGAPARRPGARGRRGRRAGGARRAAGRRGRARRLRGRRRDHDPHRARPARAPPLRHRARAVRLPERAGRAARRAGGGGAGGRVGAGRRRALGRHLLHHPPRPRPRRLRRGPGPAHRVAVVRGRGVRAPRCRPRAVHPGAGSDRRGAVHAGGRDAVRSARAALPRPRRPPEGRARPARGRAAAAGRGDAGAAARVRHRPGRRGGAGADHRARARGARRGPRRRAVRARARGVPARRGLRQPHLRRGVLQHDPRGDGDRPAGGVDRRRRRARLRPPRRERRARPPGRPARAGPRDPPPARRPGAAPTARRPGLRRRAPVLVVAGGGRPDHRRLRRPAGPRRQGPRDPGPAPRPVVPLPGGPAPAVSTGLAVAVSPHLDDAVFSAGGTLAALAAAGWRVRVVTCFTASVADPSPFALSTQLDKGLTADVDYMALRRAEDTAALTHLGGEALHLSLPEAPHRGYTSAPDLFAGQHADDGVAEPLTGALAPHLDGADLVLAPQAIGDH